MIVYDFEVFKHDWLVVILNTETKDETIIINNPDQLLKYYQDFKHTVWVGYNSRSYDKYILQGILIGANPFSISQHIIGGGYGWEYSSKFNDYPINNYDVKIGTHSLKTLEGFMGHDIHESSVSFDINRALTDDELLEVIEYCRNDVHETFNIFIQTIDTFTAHLNLIDKFKLHIKHIDKSLAKLAAEILGARKTLLNDEYEVWFPEEAEVKNEEVEDFFQRRHVLDEDLTIDLAGVPHKLSKGGIHGARPNYHYTVKSDEYLIMMDVNQQYPNIMLKYDLLPRSIRFKSRYKWSLEQSLYLKKHGTSAERKPYKDFCNITYGAMGDPFNKLSDPRNRLQVCIYAQSFIVDLIEKLEPYIELIQTNTDGILVKFNEKYFDEVDDIVFDWEERTGLTMSFKYYDSIHQKDVNNYILDGDETVGAGTYTKELTELDYDLPIIKKAVKEFFINGIPVARTILNSDKLMDFQKIVRITYKFDGAMYGKDKRPERTFRVFANVGGKSLQYLKGTKTSKIPNIPDACTIVNEGVIDTPAPDWLDKDWYIKLATKIVNDFIGVEEKTETEMEQINLWGLIQPHDHKTPVRK